jgi:hypothetical protein
MLEPSQHTGVSRRRCYWASESQRMHNLSIEGTQGRQAKLSTPLQGCMVAGLQRRLGHITARPSG